VDPSPFEMAAASELQRRVELALASLPGVYREALLLVAFEGFTPAEAAAVCRINGEAMRQRLRRARALLSERLEEKDIVALPIPTEVVP
jgi:DNA-directed RNA polymerase specialized sigma24 family protein